MNHLMTVPSPNEIMIMEYAGYKFRHGMYMRPLKKDLPIYKLLADMPMIEDGRVELCIGVPFKRRDYMYKSIRMEYPDDDDNYDVNARTVIQIGIFELETGEILNRFNDVLEFHVV
jgi:hypothetical protein